MKINENNAILTPRVFLVPYAARHVPTYHEWMQDEELQTLTASEPLSINEEYGMCTSWREDRDKLTFIVCAAPESLLPPPITTATTCTSTSTPVAIPSIVSKPSLQTDRVTPGIYDTPSTMLGDVNLFLSSASEDSDQDQDVEPSPVDQQTATPKPNCLVGELEIMIARPSARGKGLAHAALLAFLWYISTSLQAILDEYDGAKPGRQQHSSVLQYLRVKIDKDNARSVRLFEKLGFVQYGGVNYFGEVELRMGVEEGRFVGVDRSLGGEEVRVVAYAEEE